MSTPTTTTDNAATVAGVYEAFGRGDLPAILRTLSDDVQWDQWQDSFAQRADVPHLQERHGPGGVADFFAIIGSWSVNDFRVLDVVGAGRQVVAEIAVDFSLPNGGRFADEELHLWTFDGAGRVVRFRHYVDTAKHIAAARGEDTTAG